MSETMTEERLGEIEARVADAPPGRPWTAGGDDEDVPDLVREVRRLRGEIAERWEPQAKQWEERGNFWRGACAMIREQAAKVAAGAPEIARAILAMPIHAGAFSAVDAAAASRSYWPLFSLPLPGGASVEVETAERGYKVVRRGCDPWIAGTVPAPSILAAAVYVAQAVREIADTPRFVDGVKAAIEGGAAALGMLPIDDVRVGLPPGEATPLRFAIIPSGFGAAGGQGAVTELRPATEPRVERAKEILRAEGRRLRSGRGGYGGNSPAALAIAEAVEIVCGGDVPPEMPAPSSLRCNVAGLCPHHAAGRPAADDCGPLALAWKTPEELGEQAARQLDRGAANVESVVADAVREDRTDILARLDDIHARTVAASGWSTRWQDFVRAEQEVGDVRGEDQAEGERGRPVRDQRDGQLRDEGADALPGRDASDGRGGAQGPGGVEVAHQASLLGVETVEVPAVAYEATLELLFDLQTHPAMDVPTLYRLNLVELALDSRNASQARAVELLVQARAAKGGGA